MFVSCLLPWTNILSSRCREGYVLSNSFKFSHKVPSNGSGVSFEPSVNAVYQQIAANSTIGLLSTASGKHCKSSVGSPLCSFKRVT